ncbi:hypothetical protein jhhlp_002358 [Lomentospora prolificans]|uniref:DUF726 domain protein n=1 Tax=Lomentospora prolificans TaxID=41688 RepID=A0A2N3NDV3_9PEZI|nr:hypothetical protein jhhlp_002358 [Lomentospora prolificans]
MAGAETEPEAGPTSTSASDPPSSQPSSQTSSNSNPTETPAPADTDSKNRGNKRENLTVSTNGTPAAPSAQSKSPPEQTAAQSQPPPIRPSMAVELDDFGLPIRQYTAPSSAASDCGRSVENQPRSHSNSFTSWLPRRSSSQGPKPACPAAQVASKKENKAPGQKGEEQKYRKGGASDDEDEFKDAVATQPSGDNDDDGPLTPVPPLPHTKDQGKPASSQPPAADETANKPRSGTMTSTASSNPNGISEFSHQRVISKSEDKEESDSEWQEMPSYARYDMYDDDDRLIAREHNEEDDEKYGYSGLGGAGKGYTRVIMDDDAESATSLDDNTKYLFKDIKGTSMMEDDEEQRDAVSQMQATKDLLTEGQRIAYVGVVRLEIHNMVKEAETLEQTRKTKKLVNFSAESSKMWAQKMMIRVYAHMDISPAEQIMIEQLAEHGVIPTDLTPILMANSRVNNPMAEKPTSPTSSGSKSPLPSPVSPDQETAAEPPPPYETHEGEDLPGVMTPSQLPTSTKLDIDLRWTVLCDLFLVLIADSTYDARSRCLLERVGKAMDIPWIDICRFEKRVTDALEIQQQAEKENWNEDDHMEERRKMALKKRYVLMGLATVGGGLVIGLSAGLLAPMIGAGLAAGFTTIGVTGTSGFLAGAGGAAVITSSAAASGSIIGARAANRRTGAVKTFEYRPLHNNKRVNLIITVSGWMTGKVDDVRLPYSTVDSVMGDIYSVLWEPEMLRSMGDTINILATEALTQGLQQVLGNTILVSLMAALQLPVVLTKLSYLIDNPWAVSLDRATAAGLILADSLIDRNLGTRPVTLVGYSLGSRVIFSCLQELAKKGAYGLVQNVYLFGSPVVVKKDEYLRARTVVSGRFVNAFNRNDWILGYLFRLTNGGIRRVAGLGAIEECPWIENVDVSELVNGHMDYRTKMPRLLRECGWLVESDEFTEIEDPDPDNHSERQRELINEIEEARKELEREGKEGKEGKAANRFSLFRRKKALERAEWEVYHDSVNKDGGEKKPAGETNTGVLFDVDAIRAELAKEKLEVKELQSTLPPMILDLRPSPVVTDPASPSGQSATQSSPHSPPRTAVPTNLAEPRSALGPARVSSEASLRSASQERTPTLPKDQELARSPYFQHSPDPLEAEVQMTFDTYFQDKPSSSPHLARSPSPPPPPPPKDNSLTRNTSVSRAPHMVPTIAIADPWADPDDEDFGKEKEEIHMTFA